MRLIVTGSREERDRDGVWEILSQVHKDLVLDLVITGGAIGVDDHAERWASLRGMPCMVFPAPWDSHYGNGAGPIRNGWMLSFANPDCVLAFPGGPGTANLVKQAQMCKVRVLRAVDLGFQQARR